LISWRACTKGHPGLKNPALGEFNLSGARLTRLVVKPLVKYQNGALDRFCYAADTPRWIVAYDMKTYFEDPANGKTCCSCRLRG